MLPEPLVAALAPHLDGPIRRVSPVGGGCIAHSSRVETARGVRFLKWSPDPEEGPRLRAEARGLEELRAAGSPLAVPAVVAVSEAPPHFLLLEWIEQGRETEDFWVRFGEGLAALHGRTAVRYGFGEDNFIGRLPQENGWSASWPDFFRERRLSPQIRRASGAGRWPAGWDGWAERLLDRLPGLLAHEPPASLLHGDLWSGNFLPAASGGAALFDPAVYYGDPEAELAMTELFGGFDSRFYAAYRAARPPAPGYGERRDLYNLYHLLNHLNHFGGGYAASVERLLRRYGG